MKKMKFIAPILMLLICFCLSPVASFAKTPGPLLVDEADLLAPEEEEILKKRLAELSERLDFWFLILAVEDTNGRDILAYADEYQASFGYEDGAILVVDMSDREWCVATYGTGNEYISNDATYEYLENLFIFDLSEGNYEEAFSQYLLGAEHLVQEGQKGNPYENWVLIPWGRNILIGVVLGMIIALIVVFSMRSKLNSVAFKGNAAGYVKEGSFVLTRDRDIFLYRTRIKVYSPQQKSSGGSSRSGGGSRGGGRGRF